MSDVEIPSNAATAKPLGQLWRQDIIAGLINNAVTVIINFGFVLFITVFFVTNPYSYIQAPHFLIPAHRHTRAIDIRNEFHDTMRI